MRIYRDLVVHSLELMPGAAEILDRFRNKYKLALVTSAYRDAAEFVLETMGRASIFEAIITASDVALLKPHPASFLRAAKLLNVSAAECIVLEDAEKGIRAAHQAGMRSIAIPSRHTASHDFSLATQRVQSLDSVNPELLAELDCN